MAEKENKKDLINSFRDQMEALGLDEQANVILKNPFDSVESKEARQDILGSVSMDPDALDMVVKKIAPIGMYVGGLLSDDIDRMPFNQGDKVLGDLDGDRKLNEYEQARQDAIEKSMREGKQEGGEIDNQMSMLMGQQEPEQDMLPDEEMEDNYMDFILDEALTEEEEDMLMSKLQEDEQLSMLFDKVIEVASEFAGSGPVEGPGSGVSDSIPARLSDGEFVFTAKAVEEIGADELMRMMKDAEMKADERQGLVTGGPVTDVEDERVVLEPEKAPAQQINITKETVDSPAIARDEEDMIGDDIKKSMLGQSRNI